MDNFWQEIGISETERSKIKTSVKHSKEVAKDPWKTNIRETVTFIEIEDIDKLLKINKSLLCVDISQKKPLDALIKVLHDNEANSNSRIWTFVTGIDFSIKNKDLFPE